MKSKIKTSAYLFLLVTLVISSFLFINVNMANSSSGTECCLNGYKKYQMGGDKGFESCSCKSVTNAEPLEACACPNPGEN